MEKNTSNAREELKIEVNSTMDLTYNYIKNALPHIEDLSESFYQDPDTEIWDSMGDFLEAMEWILTTTSHVDSIENLDRIINDSTIWNEYIEEVRNLMEMLGEIDGLLEAKDNISVGDILMYEIIPIFKDMKSKLEFLISGSEEIDAN